MKELFLLSLFFAGLLLPLITFLSGVLFKYTKKLSNSLFLLSNKLDETLWPLLIIEFLYIIVRKLHSMLAMHFEEFISHAYFNKVKPYAKTIPYESHTNEKYFTRCHNFSVYQDLAHKIFKAFICYYNCIFIKSNYKKFLQMLCTKLSRLVLPGKLITDTPEEVQAIKCTDTYSHCNTVRVETVSTAPLIKIKHESVHTSSNETECVSYEADKSPDAIQQFNYQHSTNRENTGFVEVKQENVPFKGSTCVSTDNW